MAEKIIPPVPGIDLDNCAREPIHIPSAIQPHGLLLVLREPQLEVVQVSQNAGEVLGVSVEDLLGRSLDAWLTSRQERAVREALAGEDLRRINPLRVSLSLPTAERPYEAIAHRADGLLILELEPTLPEQPLAPLHLYHQARVAVAGMDHDVDPQELLQSVAREVRALCGFDRVMIYQFDEEWNGAVVAEEKAESLPPYLGLHYPASDIPAQARELYRRNWLRLIADVSYRPSPLVPVQNPVTGRALNMSGCVLRSVSPVHIEYLHNMGVGASMSISILRDGQLWGLIACHHQTARHVSYEVRSACELLGRMLSLQLSARLNRADFDSRVRSKSIHALLVEHMSNAENWIRGLTEQHPNLLELIEASGAAICLGGDCALVGETPPAAAVLKIKEWLRGQMTDVVFQTASLATLWPAAEEWKDTASGVLALWFSGDNCVLWFRPEVIRTVNWSGDPNKPVHLGPDGPRLHPRKSFEVWKETVRLRSCRWRSDEMEAARELRQAILGRMHRSAEELARLNAELERSNRELDSFSYIASHDLKEPLRGIQNYSQFLLEDYAEQLDAAGRERLRTLIRLGDRMEALLDSLLHYSRVGRVDLMFRATDLQEVLTQRLELLQPVLDEQHVEIRVPRPLPRLLCDRSRIGEVFHNLIANAAKYNDKEERWVEIGYLDAPDEGPEGPVFYVRDNGIGIPEAQFDTIFQIFRRLHGRDEYGGGTGAGLTIVRKIVERHGGKIWVESTPGSGTTFFFTLSGHRRS